MTIYTCANCGYSDTSEDFAQGWCPACGCEHVHAHEQDSGPAGSYDLDLYLDLGESPFDLGE